MDIVTLDLAKTHAREISNSPINSSVVSDLFKCATSYLNHKDELTFTDDGDGCIFDDDFDVSKKYIDCSSMMQAWIQGIPYETSRFTGAVKNTKYYRYGINLPKNPYSEDRPNRYYTHEIAHYLDDKGYCFKPNKDYSNIAPGDIIFVSFKTRDGSSFHDNAYLKIDHCLLVLGFKDKTHLTCLHTSEQSTMRFYDVCVSQSPYDPSSKNSYNDGIVLVGRIPYQACGVLESIPVCSNYDNVTTSSTSNGFLKTITLNETLKTNSTYTAIIDVQNAYKQTQPSTSNYVGLRASFESGASDETIVSWQYNQYPENNIYYMKFVTGNDPIKALKIYVLNNTVSGHIYNSFQLYEGVVNELV